VFYGDRVTRADRDRPTAARIAGITRRHARGRALTGAEEAAALAELAEAADGRVDLLAEEAGHRLARTRPRCTGLPADRPAVITAGADTALISRWIEEGRRRAAAARQPPFTG